MLMGYVKSDSKVILNLDRSINGSSVCPLGGGIKYVFYRVVHGLFFYYKALMAYPSFPFQHRKGKRTKRFKNPLTNHYFKVTFGGYYIFIYLCADNKEAMMPW